MGGRYYDPYIARFAGPDPIVSAPASSQGYDPFSYVRNDPLTYTDPTGYVPVPGYEGDWASDGYDEEGNWWFNCNEGCGGVSVVGVFADEIVEVANANSGYQAELLEDSAVPRETEEERLRRLDDLALRRANQSLARRRSQSASAADEPSVVGDVLVEVVSDATPGVGFSRDVDGLVSAYIGYERSPGRGTAIHVAIAAIAFIPFGGTAKPFAKRFVPVPHSAPNFGTGSGRVVSDAAKGGVETTRVGRWMSPDELKAMQKSGTLQESGGGLTHVTNPANPEAFNAAKPGSVSVEFDVPASAVKPGGRADWGTIHGPNSVRGRIAARKGEKLEMPNVTNINVTRKK